MNGHSKNTNRIKTETVNKKFISAGNPFNYTWAELDVSDRYSIQMNEENKCERLSFMEVKQE